MTYSCIIVDDEHLARKVIEKHLQSFPQLALAGTAENAMAAFELLHMQSVHLMFLDIQMPFVDGLQLVKSLKNPPAVIFTTAYGDYAAESYDLDAVDYLVKPVGFERFERSIRKFLKDATPVSTEQEQFVLVKQQGKLTKVYTKDILYIESRKDYLVIYTHRQSFIKHMTMKAMEEFLKSDQFKRIHRSFIISVTAVTGIYSKALEVNSEKIPIGDKYRAEVSGFFRYRQ